MMSVAPRLINDDDITQSTGNAVCSNGHIMEICLSCNVATMAGSNNALKLIARVLTAFLRKGQAMKQTC